MGDTLRVALYLCAKEPRPGAAEASFAITAKDLCLWYSSTQALKNISIQIPENNLPSRSVKRQKIILQGDLDDRMRNKFDKQLSLMKSGVSRKIFSPLPSSSGL